MNITDLNCLDCSICLEKYKNPHITSCGHSFCYQCIAPLLNKDCPICRKPVTTLTQNFQLLSIVDSTSTASRVMTSASPALGISTASYSSSSLAAPGVDDPIVDKLNMNLNQSNHMLFAYLCGLAQGQYDERFEARERVVKASLEAIGNDVGIISSILDELELCYLGDLISQSRSIIPKQDRVTIYHAFRELKSSDLKNLQVLVPSMSNASTMTIYKFNQMIENLGAQKIAGLLRHLQLCRVADILVPLPTAPIEPPKQAVYPHSPTPSVYSYSSVPPPLYASQLPSWGTSHPLMPTTTLTPSCSSSILSTVYSPPGPQRQWPDEIKQCLAMKASTIADARSKLLALVMTLPSSNIELQQKLLFIGLHIDDATCQTLITNLDMPAGLKGTIKSSLDLVLAMYNKLGINKLCEQIQILLSTMSLDESKKGIPCFTFRDMACSSRRVIIRKINDEFGANSKPDRGHLVTIFYLMNPQLRYCLAMYCFTPGHHLEQAKEKNSKAFELVEQGGKIRFNQNFHDLIATLMQMPLEDT